MNKREIYIKLFIVFISVLIGFMFIEIALRLINYYPFLINTNIFISNDNELLPYKLKPNFNGKYLVNQKFTVNIDSNGYRVVNPDTKRKDNSDEYRASILILGDSVVFGHGLKDNETIASQLQSLINQRDINFTVKNIGVSGYTSWNEYEALKLYLEDNNVEYVLLFYILNDITFDNNNLKAMKEESGFNANPIGRFLLRNVYSYSILINLKSYVGPILSTIGRGYFYDKEHYESIYRLRIDKEALDYSMEALLEIQNFCKENGIQFYVVIPVAPSGEEGHPSLNSIIEREVENRLDSLGIKKIVLTSHLTKLSISEYTLSINDSHPSALGMKYFSQELFEYLDLK